MPSNPASLPESLAEKIAAAFAALSGALEHEGDTAGYSSLPEDTAQPILRDLVLAGIAEGRRQERIDNGNSFVFCDHVDGRMGCVRGAGHNGPHAVVLAPYPQMPVILKSGADQ